MLLSWLLLSTLLLLIMSINIITASKQPQTYDFIKQKTFQNNSLFFWDQKTFWIDKKQQIKISSKFFMEKAEWILKKRDEKARGIYVKRNELCWGILTKRNENWKSGMNFLNELWKSGMNFDWLVGISGWPVIKRNELW